MTEYILDLTAFDSETLDDGLREEIVRCRDCKLWESNDCEWNPFCNDPDFDEPDGFCAWGKRKGAES